MIRRDLLPPSIIGHANTAMIVDDINVGERAILPEKRTFVIVRMISELHADESG